MRYSVFLQDAFDYAMLWVWLGLGLVAAAGLVWILCRYLPRLDIHFRIDLSRPIRAIKLFFRKRKHTKNIRKIETAVQNGKIDPRTAHQKICRELRLFAGSATGIPMESLVYSELVTMKYPELAALIGEYYAPEFSLETEKDIRRLMNKSRELVRKWQ